MASKLLARDSRRRHSLATIVAENYSKNARSIGYAISVSNSSALIEPRGWFSFERTRSFEYFSCHVDEFNEQMSRESREIG